MLIYSCGESKVNHSGERKTPVKKMIIMLTTDVRRVSKTIRARFDLWFESASRTILAEGDDPRGYLLDVLQPLPEVD